MAKETKQSPVLLKRVPCFLVSDGRSLPLAQAKAEELFILLYGQIGPQGLPRPFGDGEASRVKEDLLSIACVAMVAVQEKVLAILSTTETSRPRARAINGGTKTRRTSAAAATAEASPPILSPGVERTHTRVVLVPPAGSLSELARMQAGSGNAVVLVDSPNIRPAHMAPFNPGQIAADPAMDYRVTSEK